MKIAPPTSPMNAARMSDPPFESSCDMSGSGEGYSASATRTEVMESLPTIVAMMSRPVVI